MTGEFPAQKARNAENVSFDDVFMSDPYRFPRGVGTS